MTRECKQTRLAARTDEARGPEQLRHAFIGSNLVKTRVYYLITGTLGTAKVTIWFHYPEPQGINQFMEASRVISTKLTLTLSIS